MGGFTKLFSRILTSSIWSESNEVRIAWITLLAATGPDGIARTTLPGLARLSNLSIQDTEKAVLVLSSPDKYSRTVDQEGRRIREERSADGSLVGYFVFNYAAHRAVDATGAARKRKQRSRARDVTRDRHARQKTEDIPQKAEDRGQKTNAAPDSTAAVTVPDGVSLHKAGRRTWISAYVEAWTNRFGGDPAVGAMARYLRPLDQKHGCGETLSRWVRYLENTESQYANPARFASTFGEWGEDGPRVVQRRKPDMIDNLAEGQRIAREIRAAQREGVSGRNGEVAGSLPAGDVTPRISRS